MFDQTQNYGMGMPTMAGYNYQGMQGMPQQKFNNPLSPEEIQKLQKKGAQFSLGITQEEWMRGICNHRNAEGTADTLVYDQLTGEARCTICGYKFKPIEADVSIEDIKDDVERIIDILQTIKLMYIDLPAEAAREYFQIIPLLEKIPQLFEFAAKNMTKHETYNWQYNNKNMGAINMFNNLQSLFGGGMVNPGYQQPMGQVPPMAPGFPQPAPYGAAPVGYPGMSNGFGYPGASNPAGPGYQPQTTGFQFTPNQQPAPVTPTVEAPTAPTTTENGTTTVTQTVTA